MKFWVVTLGSAENYICSMGSSSAWLVFLATLAATSALGPGLLAAAPATSAPPPVAASGVLPLPRSLASTASSSPPSVESPASAPSERPPVPGMAPSAQPLVPPQPPPAEPTRLSDPTLGRLLRAEREDSGRGLSFVFLEPQLGTVSFWLPGEGDGASGGEQFNKVAPTVGALASLRFLYLSAGPSLRWSHLGTGRLWDLALELSLRIPLGRLEPFAALGLGYSWLLISPDDEAVSRSAAGPSTRLGVGFAFFTTPSFSLGARLDGTLLWLDGDAVSGQSGADAAGLGFSLEPLLLAGLHF